MADVIKLTFLTSDYTKATINVPYPNRSVDDAKVKTAMTNIIASDAMMIKNASLESRLSAELLSESETEYSI